MKHETGKDLFKIIDGGVRKMVNKHEDYHFGR